MTAPQRPAAPAPPAHEPSELAPVLDAVDAPAARADVVLASGRRYELEAGADADRLVVRGRGGEVVLRIEVGEHGPVLSFTGATVELAASKALRLSGEEVSVTATRDLDLRAGGDVREAIGGDHHTRVDGAERLEARAVEVQASAEHLRMKAMKGIRLDAEHVGLNDDPAPAPFAWSAVKPDE